VVARRQKNLEALKDEIIKKYPMLNIVIKVTDLSILENVYQLYADLKGYSLETWINNAGFGNYNSVAQQDLKKIATMLHLNVVTLTILSSLFVRDYKDVEGTQLINISSCGAIPSFPQPLPIVPQSFTLAHLPRDWRGN